MQAAIGCGYLEAGVPGEEAKHGRKILHGMPEDIKDAITALRHGRLR
jgi:hypothetical protein